MIELHNIDCMEAMKEMPDKAFDLAIVDPVFGEMVVQGGYMSNKSSSLAGNKNYNNALWKQPKTEARYFDELRRVSKNQIVWGGNYFIEELRQNSSCWLVWDKLNGENHFADCELAWTSFETAVRKFSFHWQGMLQQDMKNKEVRIHPTQKPVKLYEWILRNYAKDGDKILDTHHGSGSIAIACDNMGFDLVAMEIDAEYFEGAKKRLEEHKRQGKMVFA